MASLRECVHSCIYLSVINSLAFRRNVSRKKKPSIVIYNCWRCWKRSKIWKQEQSRNNCPSVRLTAVCSAGESTKKDIVARKKGILNLVISFSLDWDQRIVSFFFFLSITVFSYFFLDSYMIYGGMCRVIWRLAKLLHAANKMDHMP